LGKRATCGDSNGPILASEVSGSDTFGTGRIGRA
jgi:hypothetical protein